MLDNTANEINSLERKASSAITQTENYSRSFFALMASPFARILAQLTVATAGIVSRAFVSAYSQAVHSELAWSHDVARLQTSMYINPKWEMTD